MSVREDLDNFVEQLFNQGFRVNSIHQGARYNFKLMMINKLADHIHTGTYCGNCNFRPGVGDLAAPASRVVPGHGNPFSPLMILGEAPGMHEIEYGFPFAGIEGMVLTNMLEAAGIDRQNIWISNTIKCRPVSNQTPTSEQIKPCLRFLKKEIEIISPKSIIAMGNLALHALFSDAEGITKEHGIQRTYALSNGLAVNVIPTFHPAHIIRQTGNDLRRFKKAVLEDLLMAKDSTHVAHKLVETA